MCSTIYFWKGFFLKNIKRCAFYSCEKLESVYFMGNPQNLEAVIFDHEQNITIYGLSGGSVEEYAQKEGLSFCVLDNK